MTAAIEYAAVLRGHIVIASIDDLSELSEREVIRLLPSSGFRTEQKLSSGKLFSFTSTPGLSYVAVSLQPVDKQRPLLFLDTFSRRWATTHGVQCATATEHSLDGLLAANFSALFNEYGKANKTAELAADLDQTQQQLTDALSKGLDRSAELESISSEGETLLSTSVEFRSQAVNLKWKMRCQSIKSWLIGIIVIVLVIYFLLSQFCRGWRLPKWF
jgi:vesicle-associated membrane protein 7